MAKNNHTKNESQLLELLENCTDNNFLEEALKIILEKVMELEIEEKLQAAKSERTEDRKGYRCGTRERRFDTRLGTFYLKVPKIRVGGYVPGFIEPYQRSEKALLSTIAEIYLSGVSTRKTTKILSELGIEKISAAEVSELNKSLDEAVDAFRNQRFDSKEYPFLYVDALYEKIRIDHRVVSCAVEVVVGINGEGYREILAVEPMLTESDETYHGLFEDLKERGLKKPLMIISDAHTGLKAAIQRSFPGSSWQRCKVHFMRNILARVPQKSKREFSAYLKQIWTQPNYREALVKADEVISRFQKRFPSAVSVLESGLEDSLSFYAYTDLVPTLNAARLSSTNLIERLNKEIRRRTRKVGIFPNEKSYLRLTVSVLLEYSEEWSTGRVYLDPNSLTELKAILKEKKTSEDSVLYMNKS